GVAGGDPLAVSGDDERVLVLLEADAVAGAVDEVGAVAAVGDDAAGHGVDVLGRYAGAHGADGLGLGSLEDGVEVAELGRRLTGEHRACDVRAVPVHGAAEVAHDSLPAPDDPLARVVVGAGGIRAAADDGEVHVLVALLD